VTDGWLALTAALASAALTGFASLGVVWIQEWRRNKAAEHASLVQAVEVLLTKSHSITARAQQLSIFAQTYSKVGTHVGLLMGAQKPLDFPQLFEPLLADQEMLIRAASRVWMEKDQRTIALTNNVVLAAADVVTAVRPQPPGWPTKLVKGWGPADIDTVDQAIRGLAQARRALVEEARKALGQPGVDVFAVPD
jgi:hypothetical protein